MIFKKLEENQSMQNAGLGILRIITGLLIFYHGLEIFQPDTMKIYLGWNKINALPFPVLMIYLGKIIELITGACLALGLFTRTAAFFLAVNMLFICFYIGNGKFYYEDQHPFIFALLALVFLFNGSAKYALDKKLFAGKINHETEIDNSQSNNN